MDSELLKPFKLCFRVFKAAGMWQDGKQSWAYFFLGYLAHIVLIELYLVRQLIYVFQAEDLTDMADAVVLTSTYFSDALKGLVLVLNLKEIKNLVEALDNLLTFSDHDRFNERRHVRERVPFSFRIYKLHWSSAIVYCSSSIFVPIFSHRIPYKVWFPFSTEYNSISFWFASYFTVVDAFYASAIGASLDLLPVIFISFAIGLIEDLVERLSQIGSSLKKNCIEMKRAPTHLGEDQLFRNKENVRELIKCIEVHKRIKDVVRDIQSIFSFSIIAQGLMSIIVLCNGAFTITVVSLLKFSF